MESYYLNLDYLSYFDGEHWYFGAEVLGLLDTGRPQASPRDAEPQDRPSVSREGE